MISRIVSSSLVFAAVLAVNPSAAFAQQSPTGSWAAEATGDYSYYSSSCTDGTYMYLTGGYQGVGNSTAEYYARFRRYDPASNSWTNMPLIAAGTTAGSQVWGYLYPGASAYFSANGVNRIYLFGGYNYLGSIGSTALSATITNAIRMFTFTSATTGTWSQVTTASLTSTNYYNACTVLDDRIYIAGGASVATLWVFNPTNPNSPSITTGPNMPGYLYMHGMASIPSQGTVHAMGGYSSQGTIGVHYEYTPGSTNPAGGTWQARANISNGSANQGLIYGCGVINLGNRLYARGYNTTGGVQNQLFEYNPITNTWAQRASSQYGHYYWPGWVAINGKGYLYGGQPSYFYGEEYTPPSFGSAPHAPTNVAQVGSQVSSSGQALADDTQTAGWTNNAISFTANVTDPDAGQQVRWRVQVKPQAAAWNSAQVVTLQTPLGAQGFKSLGWNIPANGGYDWRWRVEDSFGNSHPAPANAWIDAFGTVAAPNTNSPDFRSDQIPPTDPVGLEPSDLDIQVQDPSVGPVTLSWIEATDNGPVTGISYELQVAREGGFNDIEAQLFSPAGQDEVLITLSVSRFDKFWRIRARDVGGNFSPWSQPLAFRVTHNDGVDHGSGDAKKQCGFAAMGAPALGSALLGLAILGLFFVRRTQNPEPRTKNS